MKYALVSVYNKKGIVDFVKVLVKYNFKIISTGGTAKVLKKANILLIPIEKITGNPEAFGGRMKTISFPVEAGILFDRNNKSQVDEAQKLNIPRIDMVVCNFYPFEQVIQNKKATVVNLIEMIDVGGPTMVRAAAKNFSSVAVIVDPQDYSPVAKELKTKGQISAKTRAALATKAFGTTANYDSLIHQTLSSIRVTQFRRGSFAPPCTRRYGTSLRMTVEASQNQKNLYLFLKNGREIRYGENPHQKGFFYQTKDQDELSLTNFFKIQGKESSFNNLLDINAAINALANLENGQPACVVIKHGNPCGAARAPTAREAFLGAWYGDSLAAFGSIIALNRPITEKLVTLMLSEKRFFEVVLSPKVSSQAKKIFQKKKNLQVFINSDLQRAKLCCELDFKRVRGGFLVQEPDLAILKKTNLKVVTKKKPTKKQIEDLLFAWSICRTCKSNSIVLAKKQTLVAAGVGQQDRKRCCQLAVDKARDRAKNSVAASDAFFPFSDGPEILIKAGVKAIIQPGGSIRDRETIKLCNKMKIAMVFTGIRSFRH